jgi:outer membrane receptor protein involved in Fe transport
MLRLSILLVASVTLLYAQSQSSSADLKGAVEDPSGAAIPGATLSVTNPQTGLTRTIAADRDGDFLFSSLPPSRYSLRVEAPGFAVRNIEGIELRVGDTVTLPVKMTLEQVGTQLDVSAQAAVIETDRIQQSSTIELQTIGNLPINRRNYLDLTLLTPGVSDSNTLVDSNDYRIAQTPQSGLSFGGSSGRSNAFFIDGVENYANSGGVRMSVSQEAVQEFQVNRSSFSAEYGGAAGGTVNIVTRSGTNNVHGDVFGFLRTTALEARNYFDPGKASFTRSQAGATLGAPIKRDKTFIFLGFERLDRHEAEFVSILDNPSVLNQITPSQQQLFNYFSSSGNLLLAQVASNGEKLLVPSSNPFVTQLFNQNSGVFPFSETNPAYSLRLDHHLSDRNNLFLRGNLNTLFQQNAELGAQIGYNRGRSFNQFDGTIAAGDTFVATPNLVIETRAMFNYNRDFITPVDQNGPEFNVEGYGSFGRDTFLPSATYERHYELLQNTSYHSGKHTIKFGWDINPVRDAVSSDTYFGGRFEFGEQIPLSNLFATALNDPNFPAQATAYLTAAGQTNLITNLNAPVTALQAFAVGAPIYYQQGFGNPNWLGWFMRYGFFAQDSWAVRPNLTLNFGLRYDLEVNPSVLGTDPNTLAPRFGFAWSPNSKTVIRGGYGLYYAPSNAQYANVAATLGHTIDLVVITALGLPTLNNPATGQPLTSIDIYQGLSSEGILGSRPINASDLAQFGLIPGPNSPGRVVFGTDPYRAAYTEQASMEVEHAFGEYSVSVAYNFSRGAHIAHTDGRNVYQTGTQPDGQPTFGLINPDIAQLNYFAYNANSFYSAGTVQVNRRLRKNFSLNSHFTWSKATDETTDFNSDYAPNNELDLRADRGLSPFNASYRVVFAAVYQSPIPTGSSLRSRLFSGWTLSPVIQYSSWRPFNILTGLDNYGDNYITNHRPWGAGRDIGRGPDLFTTDARVSRTFAFNERWHLQALIEGFNLENRTNFRSVNNIVGDVPLSSLPNPVQAFRGDPEQPLAYTSAFDPREFQVGLKVIF